MKTKKLFDNLEVSKNNDFQHSKYISISTKVIKTHDDESHLLNKMNNFYSQQEETNILDLDKKKKAYVKLDRDIQNMKEDEQEYKKMTKALDEECQKVASDIKEINNKNMSMLEENNLIA